MFRALMESVKLYRCSVVPPAKGFPRPPPPKPPKPPPPPPPPPPRGPPPPPPPGPPPPVLACAPPLDPANFVVPKPQVRLNRRFRLICPGPFPRLRGIIGSPGHPWVQAFRYP